jgi:hypothetical protein
LAAPVLDWQAQGYVLMKSIGAGAELLCSAIGRFETVPTKSSFQERPHTSRQWLEHRYQKIEMCERLTPMSWTPILASKAWIFVAWWQLRIDGFFFVQGCVIENKFV